MNHLNVDQMNREMYYMDLEDRRMSKIYRRELVTGLLYGALLLAIFYVGAVLLKVIFPN
jgi:Mg/Co/Ni transporter MgtE